MTSKSFAIWLIAISAISLWLRTGFPAYDIGDAAYDDMLFIKLAGYLGSGHWLGPYDKLTLAKGMFYPLFILLAFASAIPLKIAEQLAYLAASALAAAFVANRGGKRIGLILFAALAFNPMLWSAALAEVMREGIYLSQSLAIMALAAMVAFPSARTSPRFRLLIGVILGLVTASFWLTREEGIWILPTALVVLGASTVVRGDVHRALADRARPLAAAVVSFTLIVLAVAGLNAHYYGVFRLTEFQSGQFLQAYGAISRIKPEHWQRYIVFPREARERAYAVSPVARELKPFLEGLEGENWRNVGCSQPGRTDCSEVLSGWFMWALRGSVAEAGHATSAVEADRFYLQLAREINDACDSGRLDCLPHRATMLPPFRAGYLLDALKPAAQLTRLLFQLGDGTIGSPPSRGEDAIYRIYVGMVGDVSPKENRPPVVIRGSIGPGSGEPRIYVAGSGAGETTSSMEFLESLPGTMTADLEPGALRFVVTTNCPITDCELVVTDGTNEIRAPVNNLPPAGASLGNRTIAFSAIGSGLRDRFIDPSALRRNVQTKIAAVIAGIYRAIVPILSIIAIFGVILSVMLRHRNPFSWPIAALALASGTAVLTRIALLAYMDVSSIPGVNVRYASVASPFVIVFAVLGTCLALDVADRLGFRIPRRRQE